MRRQSGILLILVGALLLLGCEKKENVSQQQPQFSDLKDLIEHKCTMCHFSDRIFKEHRRQEEWEKIVHRMRNRNLQFISAEEEQKILDYLIKERSLPREETDTGTGEVKTGEK